MTDFSKGAAWIKGQIVPISEAKIGVTDWAVTHSDVTYDVVPVRNGAFFRLDNYLDRFQASITACRMDVGVGLGEISDALRNMVARSGLRDAYCAMVAARGTPIIPGSRDPRDCANHFYAWCVPYIHVIKPEIADQGAKIWLSETTRRIPPDSVNPLVKNYHWGDFTTGLFEAKDRGFETVILADHTGNVTEGPGFNLFAIFGQSVLTPDSGVLHGITRRTALELCRAEGFEAHATTLSVEKLMQADEVFLTSSGGGILPVRQIGDRIFSNGASGPVSARLRCAYWALMDDPGYRTEIIY